MKSDLTSLNKFRFNEDGKGGTFADGINDAMGHQRSSAEGMFMVKCSLKVVLQIKSSEMFGWDHLSVVAKELTLKGRKPDAGVVRAPSYAELMVAREMFFEDWEPVMVLLPPPSSDAHKKTAHLWRPQKGTISPIAADGTPIPLTPKNKERFDEIYANRPKDKSKAD